eukprot:sb/3461104/
MPSDTANDGDKHVNFGEELEMHEVEPEIADQYGGVADISERDDAPSFTTFGSDGGRRKKLKFFSLHDLNRYGTIESKYLEERSHDERILYTNEMTKNQDVHFITQSEIDSFKTALRIQIKQDYEGIPEFIQSKVNERVCNTYIPRARVRSSTVTTPASPVAEPKCVCGRERTDALHRVYEKEGVTWNKMSHTMERKTHIYGKVALPGGVQANFVKISDKTPFTIVESLLTEIWKIKKPGVILSLIGTVDDRNVQIPEKMREIVERTLPKTAAACDAWIFSSGVNGGCPKMLGSGTRTYGLALNTIGVCGWATLDPRIRDKMTPKRPILDPGHVFAYPSKSPESSTRFLEPNHSTFLLVDNGLESTSATGKESVLDAKKFRHKLENHISKTTSVPIISVVTAGGMTSLRACSQRLSEGSSIIAMAKSSGLAGVIHRTIMHIEQLENDSQMAVGKFRKIKQQSKKEEKCNCHETKDIFNGRASKCGYIKHKIRKHMKISRDNKELMQECCEFVNLCVEKTANVFVYNYQRSDEFDKKLLDAMVGSGVSDQTSYTRDIKMAFELGAVEELEMHEVEPEIADQYGGVADISERDDAPSFTTFGSDGGRRKKLKFFSLHDLNRYGTIESKYLEERSHDERILYTNEMTKNRDVHFITQSEIDSFKTALRIQIKQDYEGIPEFIQSKVNERVCSTYIPRARVRSSTVTTPGSPVAEPKCVCGRERTDALHRVYEKEGVTWNKLSHTMERKTHIYGKVALPGGVQANFVKISDKTPFTIVESLLTEIWKIKKPGVILSLIGTVDDRNVQIPEKMREIVERTLPKTAAACDAWIFSSGVNGGCPKMLGSGTRTYGLALNTIGVCGWATLDPRIRDRMTPKRPILDPGHVFAYPSKSPESSTRFLEPNHSTFLLVDNGLESTSATGKESVLDAKTFRHKLENHISKTTSVPIISVVTAGGMTSLRACSQRLSEGSSIIAMAKSSGLAGVIHRTIMHIEQVRYVLTLPLRFQRGGAPETQSSQARRDIFNGRASKCGYIKHKIRKHMKISRDNKELMQECCEFVNLCVEKTANVFVYNYQRSDEFDKKLLDAMVGSGVSDQTSYTRDIKMAFELGAVEIDFTLYHPLVMACSQRLSEGSSIIAMAKSSGLAGVIHRTIMHIEQVRYVLTLPLRFQRGGAPETQSSQARRDIFNGRASKCGYIKHKIRKHMKISRDNKELMQECCEFVNLCVEKTANVFVYNYQRSDEFDKKLLDAMVGSGVSDQTSYTRDIKMAFELGAVEDNTSDRKKAARCPGKTV